jgi:hypothetical protein
MAARRDVALQHNRSHKETIGKRGSLGFETPATLIHRPHPHPRQKSPPVTCGLVGSGSGTKHLERPALGSNRSGIPESARF